ncbi:MAG: hypothetical protein QOE70_2004 [Chthoniobacter sp.]|jgi:hypothetical protein|nr:hypothetical protein [Chthoniobacter sp.]
MSRDSGQGKRICCVGILAPRFAERRLHQISARAGGFLLARFGNLILFPLCHPRNPKASPIYVPPRSRWP